jgi:uncharacterized membrane protein YozB (DUF420 family)
MEEASSLDARAMRAGAHSRLYLFAGLTVAALAFAGFSRSYYLRAFFSARYLTPLVYVHGAMTSAWILLFLTQGILIRRVRLDLHRRIGIAGGALAAAIVVIGSATVARAIERRFPGVSPLRFMRIFVEFDGLSLWLFGALVCAAIIWRGRPDVHKRLMLAATVALLPPAVGRISEYVLPGSDANLLVAAVTTCAAMLLFSALDTLRHGRVHPAMAYGSASVIATNALTQLAQVGD